MHLPFKLPYPSEVGAVRELHGIQVLNLDHLMTTPIVVRKEIPQIAIIVIVSGMTAIMVYTVSTLMMIQDGQKQPLVLDTTTMEAWV